MEVSRGGGVLDAVGLVQHQIVEVDLLQQSSVLGAALSLEHRVGGQNDVYLVFFRRCRGSLVTVVVRGGDQQSSLEEMLDVLFLLGRPVIHHHPQRGTEPLELVPPVAQGRPRNHDEMRLSLRAFAERVCGHLLMVLVVDPAQERDRLYGFPAHV